MQKDESHKMEKHDQKNQHAGMKHGNHYKKLLIMAVLSFATMYVLMYSMVNTFSNIFPNINQFYMAGLMAAPMVIIEIAVMSSMYMNKKLNVYIIGGSLVLLIAFFFGIRQQVGVSDKQFLKSMIPHHAGALLMCEGANITDPEIKKLCEEIKTSQQREIDQMKAKLNELKK